MRKTRRQWLLICLTPVAAVPLLAPCHLSADSIWDRRDRRSAYLYMDNNARRVGDLLTVVFNESTTASNSEARKMSKATDATASLSLSGKGTTGATTQAGSGSLTGDDSSSRTFNGSSALDSQRQLLDQFNVTVVDVLPNGNLVIEGYRKRLVQNEMRLIRVSGIVRPNDIDIPNTIQSPLIASFRISYEGTGVDSRFINQGWFGRVTNRIWPY